MARQHTVVVFPNRGLRDHAYALLRTAGFPVEVLRVPDGMVGVGLAALHFPQECERAALHHLALQHVLIAGTGHLHADQVAGTTSGSGDGGGEGGLLRRADLTLVLPCIADSRKIRVQATLSDDVSVVMPYLNALVPSGIYNPGASTFTSSQGGVMVALYPKRVDMAKADDVLDAVRRLSRLRVWINEIWANRESITPCYERHGRPHALQIYPYLPAGHHNCGRCGEPTCLAFAAKVARELEGQVVGNCAPLRDDPSYREQRDILYALLRSGGYEVPAPAP